MSANIKEREVIDTVEDLKSPQAIDNKPLIPAFGYCRYSSVNQHENSIDAQKRAEIAYAFQKGYHIERFYVDRAVSGKTTQKREQFLEMMNDIETSDIQAVIVHKLDRFSRNSVDTLFYEQKLKDRNIQLISVAEYFDNSPVGKLLLYFLAGINAFFVENLALETMKGLKENALKGLTTGGKPPMGYDVVDKKFVVNQNESDIVKLAFTMYDEGYNCTKIVQELNALGYKTKAGNNFTVSALYALFRNEKYKGIYTFNKAKRRKQDGTRSRGQKPDDEIIRNNEGVQAIVSPELWDRVNEKLKVNNKKTGAMKAKRLYLLSGLIYCGECGHTYCGNARRLDEKYNYHIQ